MLNAWRGGARVEYINAWICRAVEAAGGAGRRRKRVVRHVICKVESAELQWRDKVSSQFSVSESFDFVSFFWMYEFLIWLNHLILVRVLRLFVFQSQMIVEQFFKYTSRPFIRRQHKRSTSINWVKYVFCLYDLAHKPLFVQLRLRLSCVSFCFDCERCILMQALALPHHKTIVGRLKNGSWTRQNNFTRAFLF